MKKAYGKCTSSGTSLSPDGLSIIVDGRNAYDTESLLDVYAIVEALRLPDSIIAEMGNTTALMGKQSTTSGDYEISWSYHPDSGLDVIFKVVY